MNRYKAISILIKDAISFVIKLRFKLDIFHGLYEIQIQTELTGSGKYYDLFRAAGLSTFLMCDT